MASSRVLCGVSQPSIVFTYIVVVDIRDGIDASGDWELYSSFGCITAIAFNILNDWAEGWGHWEWGNDRLMTRISLRYCRFNLMLSDGHNLWFRGCHWWNFDDRFFMSSGEFRGIQGYWCVISSWTTFFRRALNLKKSVSVDRESVELVCIISMSEIFVEHIDQMTSRNDDMKKIDWHAFSCRRCFDVPVVALEMLQSLNWQP